MIMNLEYINYNYIYILFSIILFFIGLLGLFITRTNLIIILISLELMLLSININFIIFANLIDDLIGYVFVIFILTIAAAEAAIGLAILVVYYRLRGLISIEYVNLLKG